MKKSILEFYFVLSPAQIAKVMCGKCPKKDTETLAHSY